MRPPQGCVVGTAVPLAFSRRNMAIPVKILLANFSVRSNLTRWADTSEFAKMESQMAWKAPKIVEVPCGMEINMYVSATRK